MLHQDISGSNYNIVLLENGTKIETFLQATSDVSRFMGAKSHGYRLYRKGKYFDYMVGFDMGDAPFIPDRCCSTKTRYRRDSVHTHALCSDEFYIFNIHRVLLSFEAREWM